MSPFLRLFFGFCIIRCVDPSFSHSYVTGKKIPHDSGEIGLKWLVKQALSHTSEQH